MFGATAALSFAVVSDTVILALAPAAVPSSVNVTIAAPGERAAPA